MKNFAAALESIITLIGVFAIFVASISRNVDFVWVLIILGGICLLHGILNLKKGSVKNTDSSAKKEIPPNKHKFLIQITLGSFIMIIGLIQLLNVSLTPIFWNIVLLIIFCIAILWIIIKHKKIL